MILKIKRYHIILTVCICNLFLAAGIFSKERVWTLKGSLPTPETAVSPMKTSVQEVPVRETTAPQDTDKKKPVSPVVRSKKIAITFDDGPHPVYTERLLEILNEHRVPSTFFVVGQQVEKHPGLLQKIFQEGHEVANHTYSHPDMRGLSEDELVEELDRTHRLVQAITLHDMRYFRPPGGRYNSNVVQRAQDIGYRMILWTVLPRDHTNPSSDLIYKRVLKSVRKDGVILLHSGVENTLTVLPKLISSLRRQGYSFVTLSDMGPEISLSPLLVRSD